MIENLLQELSTKLKKSNLNYCVDVFFHYGTDANAAIRAGNNVYAAAFGMAVINSHGKERCHIDSIVDTTKTCDCICLRFIKVGAFAPFLND